jgi:hypothetical protein
MDISIKGTEASPVSNYPETFTFCICQKYASFVLGAQTASTNVLFGSEIVFDA